jgi:aminoglycoside phosphotransferase (APT) family kinase protein
MAGESSLRRGGLAAFLKERLPGLCGEMRLSRLAGGQSNPTFLAEFGTHRLVIRKRPDGALLPSAHAVDREYRVQAALADSGVPVPRMLLYHGDPGLIGTDFYVMEAVDGRVFHDAALPGLAPGERRAIYRDMAAVLARLHGIDWRAAGLEGFGRPANYFQRQIDRWSRQWRMSRSRQLPDIDRLMEWLPKTSRTTRPRRSCMATTGSAI